MISRGRRLFGDLLSIAAGCYLAAAHWRDLMYTEFNTTAHAEHCETGPACRGSCAQGRASCPHPMLCRAHLDAYACADVLAEMGQDTVPATLDDAREAAGGVWAGACELAGIARRFVVAVWRSL